MSAPWFDEDLMYEGPAPCRRDHAHGEGGGAIRYLSNKGCVVCAKINRDEWQGENHDRVLELQQRYRDNNRPTINERRKEQRAADPKKYRDLEKQYRDKVGREEINRRARENYRKRKAAE